MKHPMMSAFGQGWGMPSASSIDRLSCLWDWRGRLKGCCSASVQSRSPLASCSCCLALMAGGCHGWTCGMSLALCCSTLHIPADEVGHFLLFQKLIHHVCAAGSGYVTAVEPPSWPVSAISSHSGQQDSAAAHGGCPRETQGNSQDCTHSHCGNMPGKAFLQYCKKILLREC